MDVSRRRPGQVGVRGRIELVHDRGGEEVAHVRLHRARPPCVARHGAEVGILVAGGGAQVAAALRAGEVRGTNRGDGRGRGARGIHVIERRILTGHVPGGHVVRVLEEVEARVVGVEEGAVLGICGDREQLGGGVQLVDQAAVVVGLLVPGAEARRARGAVVVGEHDGRIGDGPGPGFLRPRQQVVGGRPQRAFPDARSTRAPIAKAAAAVRVADVLAGP